MKSSQKSPQYPADTLFAKVTPQRAKAEVAACCEHLSGQDPRRVRRFGKVLLSVLTHPGAAIPQACGQWADVTAAYGLAAAGKLTYEHILDAHAQATACRIKKAQVPVILVVQDTTSLNYSGREATEGLGPIGNNADKTQGIFVHSHLCMNAHTGVPLGLFGAKLWCRDPAQFKAGPAGERNRLSIEEKESRRWLEGLQAAQELQQQLGPTQSVISVADREGDIYEVFAHRQQNEGAHLLVRQQHNRALAGENQPRSREQLKSTPVRGHLEVSIGARPGQRARRATLEIRYMPVELSVPCNQAKYQKATQTLKLWQISATEPNAPAGVEAVDWHLWCSQSVATLEEAQQQIRYYCQRWQIEVLHRVYKSGCQVESRQVRSVCSLKFFATLDLLVAVYLMALTQSARETPDAPASDWFSAAEMQVLQSHMRGKVDPTAVPPSLEEMVCWIGRLGGYLARKSDGPPGPLRLWRGLVRLRDLTLSWNLLTQHNLAIQTSL
jgi:hypothetical protein